MVMDKDFSLSAKDICSIVKACASSGVSDLKIGELHIKFGSVPITVTQDPTFIHYESQDLPSSKDDSTESLKSPQEKELGPIPDDLYITDPVAWEEANLRG